MARPGPPAGRALPRAALGPHPALPPGPGAGRLAAPRGDGGDRRAGRGDPGRGPGHRHLLRHARTPSRSARYVVVGLHQHRLPARRRGRAARARRGARSGSGSAVDHRRTGCSRSEEAECLADCDRAAVRAGEPPLRRAPDRRRRSTRWSTSSRRAGGPTRSPRTGRSCGSGRTGGLRVDPERDRRARRPRPGAGRSGAG